MIIVNLVFFKCKVEDEHGVLLWNHFNVFNRLMVPRLVINFSSWRVFKEKSAIS